MQLDIGHRRIGGDASPMVVAELSGNHNGSLSRALELIDAAADAGADAVKLQTFTPEAMTLDVRRPPFVVEDVGVGWRGRTLFDLYRAAQTPLAWHETLFRRAGERGLVCFSTPFDADGVTALEELGAPAFKIASFELTHHPLLERVARTGKPVIMSTGMADQPEIAESVAVLRDAGATEIVLLQCTSAYPATIDDANLQTIPWLAATFGCLSGLSDHTPEVTAPVVATALGAAMIEKHLTLSRADGGVDAAFSLEPEELAQTCRAVAAAHRALGSVRTGPSPGERAARPYRRSLFAAADIRAGEVLTDTNIAVVRPEGGLPPRDYTRVLGCRAARTVRRGDPITADTIARAER